MSEITISVVYGRCAHKIGLTIHDGRKVCRRVSSRDLGRADLLDLATAAIDDACEIVTGLLNDSSRCVFDLPDLALSQGAVGSATGAVAAGVLEILGDGVSA